MADQDLRAALERQIAAFESAGMDEDVKAAKAALAELDKAAAAEEPQPEEPTEPAPALEELKKAELLALADERGLDVNESLTKAEIVEALEAEKEF